MNEQMNECLIQRPHSCLFTMLLPFKLANGQHTQNSVLPTTHALNLSYMVEPCGGRWG